MATETRNDTPTDDFPDDDVDVDSPVVRRLRSRWHAHLDSKQRAAVTAWAAFAATFGITRAITHWIHDGHGPSGGGMSVGGRHFHHYNIGIALLTGVGLIAVRGEHKLAQHPATATSYGVGTALIVDEAALLIDLKDVYWARDGRSSVDLAVGLITVGGLGITGSSFWPVAARELRPRSRRG
ncbi:hypothetical protein [uncultured Jatrophihabitans sp.]|uniref:hypothetical protein n=1 Tax=uncultured Jatrophihabitans sp. TaxID=1610747 RepID=UPI0035CAF65F